MPQKQLSTLFLEQSTDLIWMIDPKFNLVYANQAYLSLMKEVTGEDKKLNDPIFVEGFGEGYIQKWKAYYQRAIQGEHYEIEEHFYHAETNEVQYSQVTFKPIVGDNQKIIAVACQSKDITRIVKQRSEANQLMDASLDIFCTINEDGNFVFVSEAATRHWGYTPEELLSIPYRSLILEEDVPKTDAIAADIISGTEIRTFINRYIRKDGGIAFNLWSAKWDANAKLMYCVARDGKEHVEKEEIILQREQRFKSLVQEGADLIGILDVEGNYIYVSPTSASILGIAPEEFIGRSPLEFVHPDDSERVMSTLQKIYTDKKVIVEPFRFRNDKNEWRWIETVLTNMLDNPAVNGIVANSRDITEKVEQEAKIRQSQKRFESLVENSLDGIIIISAEGKTTYASGSVKNILGYSPKEVMGMDIRELIHPEDVAGVERALAGTIDYPGVPMQGYTSRVRHKNGSWRWIEAVITNLIHNPSVQGIVDNFRDVTDKIEDDRKRKLLESVITNTKDAVLITEAEPFDEPGPKIIYVNEAFTKMTGYEASEVIGKTPRILQGPNSDQAELSRLSKALRKWETCEITTINYKKNGEEFWINFTVTPVANETGWYTHWIAIERDVTEEKKLKELNRLTRQLAKIGSWEVNLINQTLYWSEEVHQLHETDSASFVPDLETAINFYREDFRSMVQTSIERSITTGKPFDFEAVLVTATKKEVWVRSIGNAELIDGKCQRIYGSFQDINERKEAEVRLQNLSDNIPGVVFQYLLHPDGTDELRNVSKGAEKIWGYSPKEIADNIDLVWNQTKAGGNYEAVRHSIIDSVENKSNWSISYPIISPDGEKRILQGLGNPEFLADGTVLFNSVVLDITQEAKTQELLDDVIKLTKIGSWEVDVINNTVFWSDEIHRIYETDPFTFLPNIESAINFYREDYRHLAQSNFEQCMITGESYDIEAVVVTATKKEVWVRTTAKAEIIDGVCIRVYGSFQNIHEKKIAEEQLTKAYEEKNSILESIGDAFFAVDTNWTVTYWNHVAEKLLQKSKTDVIGKNLWEEYADAIETDFYKQYHKAMDTGESVWFVEYYPTLKKWFEVSVYSSNEGLSIYFKDVTQRKKSEQEKNSLQKTLENSLNEIYIFDSETLKFTYANRGALLNLGYSAQEIKALTPLDLKPEYTVSSFRQLITLLYNEKERVVFFTNHKRKDGSLYPVEVHLQLLAEGNNNSFVAIILDISERIEAEEKNRFKANLLSTIGQAAIATDLEGIVNYWNKAAENIYGWKQEEAIGQNIVELTPNEASKEQAKQIMDTLKKGQTWSGQFNVRKKDGTFFHAHVTNSPIYDETNKLTGIIGISSDITKETKNEELLRLYTRQLELSNERFEKVTEATSDAIWDWDIANNSFYRSQNVYKFFGKSNSKKLSTKDYWNDAFFPDDLEEVKKSLSKALKDPNTNRWEAEYRIVNESGSMVYVIDRGLIIRDTKGEAIRMIGAMTDITDRKNQQKQMVALNESLQAYTKELERSNEELEQFAFITSHDLQEPLRMISSFMDQLKRNYGNQLDEKALQYIHFATDGAKRMKQIILDLLEYSRAGRPTDSMEQVKVNEIISDYLQLRRKIISEKSVVISTSELPTIYSYNAAVTQVFHALLDNAIKYSIEGTVPQIVINATEDKEEWKFSVKDNGIGIDSAFYDKIFVIFQRLHNRSEFDGTGIGLSIAKKHVEFLGGKIWLESKPGEGSIFYFSIPKR